MSSDRLVVLLRACRDHRELSELLHFLPDDIDATFVGRVQLHHSIAKELGPEREREGGFESSLSKDTSSHPNNSWAAARIVLVLPVPGGP